MANKRITDLTAASSLSTNDYTIIDNSSGGTKKYDLGTKLNTLTNNVGTLSSLTTTDKSSLVGAINEVKATGGSGGGGESSASILIITDNNGTLNKTINEIKTAIDAGTPTFVKKITGGTSDFTETHRLSAVSVVYRYASNVWRVAVEFPIDAGTISSKGSLFKSGVYIYEASTTSAYPTYYAAVVTHYSNVIITSEMPV